MRIRWELLLLPPLLFSVGLLIASQFVFVRLSFFEDQGYGRVGDTLSWGNYIKLFSGGLYLNSLWQTIVISAQVVLASLLFGFPAAYILARMRSRWGGALLALIVISSFITIVVKVLGLLIIFGGEGPVNSLLRYLGIIDRPLRFIGSNAGVVLGLTQYTIGFFVVLMFGIIRTIPVSLEEAAEIHGASRWRVMWRVILPISLPGLLSGSLIVFNLSMGAFASAALLGGGRVLTLPVLIQQTLLVSTEYGMAAALSAVLTLVVLFINILSVVLVARARPQTGAR